MVKKTEVTPVIRIFVLSNVWLRSEYWIFIAKQRLVLTPFTQCVDLCVFRSFISSKPHTWIHHNWRQSLIRLHEKPQENIYSITQDCYEDLTEIASYSFYRTCDSRYQDEDACSFAAFYRGFVCHGLLCIRYWKWLPMIVPNLYEYSDLSRWLTKGAWMKSSTSYFIAVIGL